MAAKRVANTKWPPSPTQVKPGETAGGCQGERLGGSRLAGSHSPNIRH